MKLVKLSLLTLCLGILVASCNNAGGNSEKKDTVVAQPATPPAAPAPKVDSAKKDSTATAPTPEKK